MKTKGFRTLIAMTAALVLLWSAAASAGAAGGTAAAGAYRIVTLGDSLAAGYEPGMTEKSVPYGYSERLLEQALFRGHAEADNYGILGLRTEGLIKLLQGASDGKVLSAGDIQDFASLGDPRITAQAAGVAARSAALKDDLAQADLVVLTIGANDFSHFLTSALKESMDNVDKSLHDEFPGALSEYIAKAEQAIRLIHGLAPKARILLADQYLPLPKLLAPDPAIYDLLYEKAVAPMTTAVDELAAKLGAEGVNMGSVHIAEKFKGKEGALTHMTVSFLGESKPDIHPKQDGYAAIAEAFAQAVWKEYRKPAVRAKDVPISVVVDGVELIMPNKPVVKAPGVTFLALRDVSDAMGADLLWTESTKTAVFKQNGRKVSITIGAGTMKVNGVSQKLATPAYLQQVGKEKKTYVPLAVIATGLSYNVVYSKNLQTAFINP